MSGEAQHRWRDCSPKPAWGKFRDGTGEFHPLEHHSADVAACFAALLRDPVLRDRFEQAAGEEGFSRLTEARLCLIAFLHDFGKLNVGFQFDVLSTNLGAPNKVHHIKAALWACERMEVLEVLGLLDMAAWGAEALEEYLRAALAHHGIPARSLVSGRGPDHIWRRFGDYDPITGAQLLARRGREWFPQAFETGPDLPRSPALAHLFAGVLTLADQLGSNGEFFPFCPTADPHYLERARQRARRAVLESGFRRDGWADDATTADFATTEDYRTVFDFDSPRPLQREVADAPIDCPLLILESETGSGKTEAALIRFAKLWRAGRVDGLYFALPTRAAALQLHRRVHTALQRLFPSRAHLESVLAVPGYLKVGETHGKRVGRFDVEWSGDPDEATRRARWSAESARKFLTATVGVGTVDQALLAGLKVKWAHFRGASLARSLLVVDEVHASDVYMTEILRTLLRDHLALGGHALLMSATLGSKARDALVRNATRRRVSPGIQQAKSDPYPALTLARRDQTFFVQSFEHTGYTKRVAMTAEPILGQAPRIADRALREAEQGGKVLVVRNTVKQAQAVFSEVCRQGGGRLCLQVEGSPAVHHSRFAVEDRRLLDGAVEKTLGKGRAAGGWVVIGTQTLEQSLDIDADLLISDLCPVDVLLQRIGRIHRHADVDRPGGFARPRCVVLVPEEGLDSGLDGGLLRYGLGMSRNGGIYRDLRVLELTRRLIEKRPEWPIPESNRELVEEATHPERLAALEEELGSRWLDQANEAVGRAAAEQLAAKAHVLDRRGRFADLEFPPLDEAVRTRLGEDGPRIRLSEPVNGPFGQPVKTFNLPAHLFRRPPGFPSRDEIESASLDQTEGELLLRVGSRAFRYDRSGIRPATEKRQA
ncbi:CRISPR-associated helicase Cas3' [Candidatus Palauibacter sp.]|uniref:CRISPR-associated helicase Cas3' n=1 Tax=Candidatus Palauibacter sp. TaxID=3101350 RepID=UPI003AF313C7